MSLALREQDGAVQFAVKAVHLRLKAAREAFVEVVEFIAANTRSNPNAAFAGSVFPDMAPNARTASSSSATRCA